VGEEPRERILKTAKHLEKHPARDKAIDAFFNELVLVCDVYDSFQTYSLL
jgi:hypothetical protein